MSSILHIRTLTGSTLTILISNNANILMLKNLISHKTQQTIHLQRIILNSETQQNHVRIQPTGHYVLIIDKKKL